MLVTSSSLLDSLTSLLKSVIRSCWIACLAVSRSARSVSWSVGSLAPPTGSTGKQAIQQDLITDFNKDVKESSKELDVTNIDAKVFYTNQKGTELAAVVISGKEPPKGSGLEKPTFAPKTFFAYRDPGAPYVPSLIVMGVALVLFVAHVAGLG